MHRNKFYFETWKYVFVKLFFKQTLKYTYIVIVLLKIPQQHFGNRHDVCTAEHQILFIITFMEK